jgi:hypothetical protein
MRTRSLFPLGAVVLAAAALAAPAGLAAPRAAAPAADALLARSAKALDGKQTFRLQLSMTTSAKSDGTLTPAQLRKAVQSADIDVTADLSPDVVAMSGTLSSGGQTLAAELRSAGNELYIRLLGKWYGTKSAKPTKGGKAGSSNGLQVDIDPADLKQGLEDVLGNGLDATLTEGPVIDGVPTWKVAGEFEGAELAKALKKNGVTPSAKDVNRLAGRSDVAVYIGRDDELPRRMEITSTLAGADLTSASASTMGLVPLPKAGTKGLRSVTVKIVVGMSRFDQKVTFERPASFKPIESMLEALFGGLLGGAGTSTTKSA